MPTEIGVPTEIWSSQLRKDEEDEDKEKEEKEKV